MRLVSLRRRKNRQAVGKQGDRQFRLIGYVQNKSADKINVWVKLLKPASYDRLVEAKREPRQPGFSLLTPLGTRILSSTQYASQSELYLNTLVVWLKSTFTCTTIPRPKHKYKCCIITALSQDN